MPPPVPPPSDQMRAAGSGRRKVALPPGRSQLDWIRTSLQIRPRKPRTVTLSELRKHSSRQDAWLAIDSYVYDVTPYIEYHPGGIPMILAGAGKDATALFTKYHAWVNVGFMLKTCFIGMLDTSEDDIVEQQQPCSEDSTEEADSNCK